MNYDLIKKIITLVSFTGLIVLFLLYRTGKFNAVLTDGDQTIQTSPNGGKIPAPSAVYDSTKPARLSSSKSMVLTDKNALNPSVKGAQVRSQGTSNSDERVRMSSSKSLVMVENDPYIIEQKKRAYLSYMLVYRSTYFQDSLRKSAKPLPALFQSQLDSMKFTHKKINWFGTQ